MIRGSNVPRSKYLIKYFQSKKHVPSEQVNSFLQSQHTLLPTLTSVSSPDLGSLVVGTENERCVRKRTRALD